MSCIHGWVFDFDACAVEMRRRPSKEDLNSVRPVSGFQQVPVFDMDEGYPQDDDLQTSNRYINATSSFKHHNTDADNAHVPNDHHDDAHVTALRHHIQSQQPQQYVAVLNDPAMKQKLKERNSRLQDT